MKCQHPLLLRGHGIALADGVTSANVTDGRRSFLCDVRVCMSCGAWLSLGQSDDEPEEVQIEILAALLVRPGGFIHVAHRDHHDREWIDDDYNFEFRDDCIGRQAGLLCAEIIHHEARDARRGAR